MRRLIAQFLHFPTLWYNRLSCALSANRNWCDPVEEKVWLSALPDERLIRELHGQGLRGVVNTCEEFPGLPALYEDLGIKQLHLPTVDYTPPSLEDCTRGVAFMREQIASGGGVLVHCKAGRGRSVTVLVCYLMAEAGMAPAEANAHIVRARRQANPRIHKRPVVQAFAEKCKREQV